MHNSAVEQIKERLSIVEVVSQYVQLTRAGKSYRGLSPFNKEKTPSFYVSPDRGMYYCFSSGKGGDLFTFVEEMEGVDFRGALKLLAERAGVELHQENKDQRDQRERQYGLLEAATQWFERELAHRDDARAYLVGRGLTEASIVSWRLGYAPNTWRHVSEVLKKDSYTEHEIEAAGLTKRGEREGWYERFRGRILFPLFDVASRPIAYSGRLFEREEGKDAAKYLNSPEGALFDKSRVLYGYDRAKQSMRKYDFAILVEGQMDLVLSHQMGYTNTVAVSGTALSETHLDLIARMTNNIVMAFDADPAGIRSAGRGAKLALARGMEVKVARLPEGKDPADLVLENPEEWKKAVRSATHIIEFLLTVYATRAKDHRDFARIVRSEVLPFVARIKQPIDRAQFVTVVAERLRVPEHAVEDEVVALARHAVSEIDQATPRPSLPSVGESKHAPRSRYESLLRSALGVVWWIELTTDPALDSLRETARACVRQSVGNSDEAFMQVQDQFIKEKEKLLFETERILADHPDGERALMDIVEEFSHEALRREADTIAERLRTAELSNDTEEVERLLMHAQELARRMQRT